MNFDLGDEMEDSIISDAAAFEHNQGELSHLIVWQVSLN